MYNKQTIIKISELLTSNINRKPIVACQEDFLKNIPANIFDKIIAIVISESLENASSLRNFIHLHNMQHKNIDIIGEDQFKRFNPIFDFIFVDRESQNMIKFISFLGNCKKTIDTKICLFCSKLVCNSLPLKGKPVWIKFHGKWVKNYLIFQKNTEITENKNKFVDECHIEDDYGKIL